MQMMAQFAEFKKTMLGKNPEAIVKQMLANGQMSQAQFEQLKQQAQISQLQLAQQMNNVVRYPNGFTYNAGMSPFCGGCCSGC